MKYVKHQKAIIKCFLLIMVLAVMFVSGNCVKFIVSVRYTLTESKNAEFALRLLAYDYYSRDQYIYNPLAPDGLTEGVAERVREMSGAEGTIILGSWDAARQAPRSFTYIKDKFVVVYNYDEEEESRWKLCYQFREAAKPDW